MITIFFLFKSKKFKKKTHVKKQQFKGIVGLDAGIQNSVSGENAAENKLCEFAHIYSLITAKQQAQKSTCLTFQRRINAAPAAHTGL